MIRHLLISAIAFAGIIGSMNAQTANPKVWETHDSGIRRYLVDNKRIITRSYKMYGVKDSSFFSLIDSIITVTPYRPLKKVYYVVRTENKNLFIKKQIDNIKWLKKRGEQYKKIYDSIPDDYFNTFKHEILIYVQTEYMVPYWELYTMFNKRSYYLFDNDRFSFFESQGLLNISKEKKTVRFRWYLHVGTELWPTWTFKYDSQSRLLIPLHYQWHNYSVVWNRDPFVPLLDENELEW